MELTGFVLSRWINQHGRHRAATSNGRTIDSQAARDHRRSNGWPGSTMNHKAMNDRRGFSLLEILLALAILGGSLAVLSQIAEIGTSAAREARDLSICRILCQAKLSEVMLNVSTGISPQSVFDAPWNHSIPLRQQPTPTALKSNPDNSMVCWQCGFRFARWNRTATQRSRMPL